MGVRRQVQGKVKIEAEKDLVSLGWFRPRSPFLLKQLSFSNAAFVARGSVHCLLRKPDKRECRCQFFCSRDSLDRRAIRSGLDADLASRAIYLTENPKVTCLVPILF